MVTPVAQREAMDPTTLPTQQTNGEDTQLCATIMNSLPLSGP